MRSKPLMGLLCVTALLAGCFGGGDDDPGVADPSGRPGLAEGKGALTGILVDDIYRPIPQALILLKGTAFSVTTNSVGEFTILDLVPDTYIVVVSAPGHEAVPANVDVVAGEYEEVELLARRLFSEGGRIVTAEFSAFIPCAADFVVNGVVANCLGDLSGDSFRAGFTTENETIAALGKITWMVTEAKTNKVGDYTFQVREDNGETGGGDRYAVGNIVGSDYIKMVNQFNVTNTEHNEQQNNVPWTGDKDFATIIFYTGQFKNETTSAGQPVDDAVGINPICCGVGASAGIKAKFIQSIFIGEPAIPIAQYCVLGTNCS